MPPLRWRNALAGQLRRLATRVDAGPAPGAPRPHRDEPSVVAGLQLDGAPQQWAALVRAGVGPSRRSGAVGTAEARSVAPADPVPAGLRREASAPSDRSGAAAAGVGPATGNRTSGGWSTTSGPTPRRQPTRDGWSAPPSIASPPRAHHSSRWAPDPTARDEDGPREPPGEGRGRRGGPDRSRFVLPVRRDVPVDRPPASPPRRRVPPPAPARRTGRAAVPSPLRPSPGPRPPEAPRTAEPPPVRHRLPPVEQPPSPAPRPRNRVPQQDPHPSRGRPLEPTPAARFATTTTGALTTAGTPTGGNGNTHHQQQLAVTPAEAIVPTDREEPTLPGAFGEWPALPGTRDPQPQGVETAALQRAMARTLRLQAEQAAR